MKPPHIVETKKVFVAWTNTDLTEGKGHQIPLVVCEQESTAKRIGERQNVQGCNCDVIGDFAFRIEGSYVWYVPGRIFPPTKDDESAQKLVDSKRLVIEKMRAAGISEEEIKTVASL